MSSQCLESILKGTSWHSKFMLYLITLVTLVTSSCFCDSALWIPPRHHYLGESFGRRRLLLCGIAAACQRGSQWVTQGHGTSWNYQVAAVWWLSEKSFRTSMIRRYTKCATGPYWAPSSLLDLLDLWIQSSVRKVARGIEGRSTTSPLSGRWIWNAEVLPTDLFWDSSFEPRWSAWKVWTPWTQSWNARFPFSRLQDVTFILGNQEAFVALKNDGGWHRMVNSGVFLFSSVLFASWCLMAKKHFATMYIRLYQHLPAFSTPVWFHRGVVAWGNPAFGGDLGAARPLLQNVAKLWI